MAVVTAETISIRGTITIDHNLVQVVQTLQNRISHLEAEVEKKSDTKVVESLLARVSQLESAISEKAQKNHALTCDEKDAELEKNLKRKADSEHVDAELAKKANTAEVRNLEEVKADKTAIGVLQGDINNLKEVCATQVAALEKQKADDLEHKKMAALERQQSQEKIAEIERQRIAHHEELKAKELEKEKAAELEKHKAEELEKQKAEELEKQKAEELEKQKAAELERHKTSELERQQNAEKIAEMEKQRLADLEKQKQNEEKIAEIERSRIAHHEELKMAEEEKQKAADIEKQKLEELAKQQAEQASALQRTRSTLDVALTQKSGKEFLEAQVANLSETAKVAFKAIEVSLKEDIEFTSSSSQLTTKGKKIVAKVSEVLKKYPTMVIRVEGHTGCRCIAGGGPPKRGGPKCKAVELSNDRAGSVIEHLRILGCKNELKSRGHGCIFRVGMAVKIFPAEGQ